MGLQSKNYSETITHTESQRDFLYTVRNQPNSIFPDKIEYFHSSTYRYEARMRIRRAYPSYYKRIGKTMEYFRTMAKIDVETITKYLGSHIKPYENYELGEKVTDLIVIDEFCAILNIDFIDFYKKFMEIK